METKRVSEFLFRAAERWPEKTALICGTARETYRHLAERARGLATNLKKWGLRPGERVGICLPNSPECVIALFGVAEAGGIFVPLSDAIRDESVGTVLRDCAARWLITSTGRANCASGAPCLGGVITVDPGSDVRAPAFTLAQCSGNGAASGEGDAELACLIYTSGSTGAPKGVMCDHSSIDFASASIIEYLGIGESDVTLSALPLSFTYGLYQLLTTFRTGGTLVLERSFAFPARIVELVEKEGATVFPGAPTMHALLLPHLADPARCESLRCMTNAAAALAPEVIRGIRGALPRVRFFSMYGQTETARSLYLPPELIDQKPGSVGVPIPRTQAWVETEGGNMAGSGEIGELVVEGAHVMRGYWNDPRQTAERFRPGRAPGERAFHTGDLFQRDADGHFQFVSRRDDIIKTRGEKVAPQVVENAIAELPGVVEVAVFGAPDRILGEAVHAVVATDGRPLAAGRVIAHCRARLDPHMVPKEVVFLPSLPKSPNGKIRKRDLRCVESPAFAI